MHNRKSIFLTLPEDIIARNIYYTDFWPEFLRLNTKYHLILLVPTKSVNHFRDIFSSDKVSVVSFHRARSPWYEQLVMSIARSGIDSETNRWSKMRSYERGDSSLISTVVKRCLTYCFGSSNQFKRLLRRFILLLPEDAESRLIFDKYQPESLVAFSMTNFDFDVVLARSAKKRHVPIVGMVRSWDNLSSHGLLRVLPDVFLLQNQFLMRMAHKYQAIAEGAMPMDIVGLPHYDVYSQRDALMTREEFCATYHLDASKKIIYWVAMGEFLFPNDADIGTILERLMDEGSIEYPAQILFSPHPKFLETAKKVHTSQYITSLVEAPYVNQAATTWEEESRNIRVLANIIAHADVMVMGASTMAIDGAALNRPVVCIGFNGLATKTKFWHSVERFYDSYTHFQALVACGGLRIAKNPKELAVLINEYLRDPMRDQAGRIKALEVFAPHVGPSAGKYLATRIYHHLSTLL